MKVSRGCENRLKLSVKPIFLSGLSALLLALSFPKFNLEFLAWFAFIPLFFAVRNLSKEKSFFLFFICGLIFWTITVYWLAHVTLAGALLLILYLALYFGIFGFILSSMRSTPCALRLFSVPAVWVLLEYSRGNLFTGFPWALLGHSQYLNLPIIQIADIFGAWGVSFAVMLVNFTLYVLVSSKFINSPGSKIDKISIIFVFILVGGMFTYGFFRLRAACSSQRNTPIKISVVQGNIPQELEYSPGVRESILNKYKFLSLLAAQESPDLIVWPEAALPIVSEAEPVYFDNVRELAKQTHVFFLIGSVTNRQGAYYNSALLVSRAGKLSGWYDKLHLVPFGEYIPLRHLFPFLQAMAPIGDEKPGREYTVFEMDSAGGLNRGQGVNPVRELRSFTPLDSKHLTGLKSAAFSNGVKFSALICFEDVFPELSRQFVKRGAQFLVNITNDSWFKKTFASYQHFQASVFRAVENRVYVLRSANTGVSGFISPAGKIISWVADSSGRKIFVDGYKTEEIFVKDTGLSIYTRFGDWLIISLCAVIVLLALYSRGHKL